MEKRIDGPVFYFSKKIPTSLDCFIDRFNLVDFEQIDLIIEDKIFIEDISFSKLLSLSERNCLLVECVNCDFLDNIEDRPRCKIHVYRYDKKDNLYL